MIDTWCSAAMAVYSAQRTSGPRWPRARHPAKRSTNLAATVPVILPVTIATPSRSTTVIEVAPHAAK